MEQSSQLTRLVQALKGVSRFSSSAARVAVSQATSRDCLVESSFGNYGSVMNGTSNFGTALSGVVTITDSNGNLNIIWDVTMIDGCSFKD